MSSIYIIKQNLVSVSRCNNRGWKHQETSNFLWPEFFRILTITYQILQRRSFRTLQRKWRRENNIFSIILLSSTELQFQLKWWQFLVKLAFSFTIKNAQAKYWVNDFKEALFFHRQVASKQEITQIYLYTKQQNEELFRNTQFQ